MKYLHLPRVGLLKKLRPVNNNAHWSADRDFRVSLNFLVFMKNEKIHSDFNVLIETAMTGPCFTYCVSSISDSLNVNI